MTAAETYVMSIPELRAVGTQCRIFIADPHTIFRRALRQLFEVSGAIAVIGEHGDGMEVVRQVAELKPDVLLLDLALNNLHGIDVLRHLASMDQLAKIVVADKISERHFQT